MYLGDENLLLELGLCLYIIQIYIIDNSNLDIVDGNVMASYFDMFIDHLLNQMLSFDISLPFN